MQFLGDKNIGQKTTPKLAPTAMPAENRDGRREVISKPGKTARGPVEARNGQRVLTLYNNRTMGLTLFSRKMGQKRQRHVLACDARGSARGRGGTASGQVYALEWRLEARSKTGKAGKKPSEVGDGRRKPRSKPWTDGERPAKAVTNSIEAPFGAGGER